jgi:hypothetical protein
MFFFCLQEYEDIINEDYHKFVQVFHKYLVHEVHEVSRCIHQPKRHHCILIQSISCTEGCLRYVLFSNFNLMVTRSQVDLQKDTCSFHLVRKILDPWERILILNGHFIHGPVIHTHMLCFVFLVYKQHGCSPRGRTRMDESL